MNNEEVWLAVPGWEGTYEISSLGSCRRIKPISDGRRGLRAGGVLKPLPNRNGYVAYVLQDGGRRSYTMAHRLVLEALVGPANGLQCNHIDGNKVNNAVSNLEWVTCGDNHRHAYRTGLRSGNNGGLKGEANGMAKLSLTQVAEIRALRGEMTQTVIAKRYGISQSQVSYIQIKGWK